MQGIADFLHGLPYPMLVPIVRRSKCSAAHPVNVEAAVQMVYFMLQNARVPSRSFNDSLFSLFIEALDAHAPRAGNHGGKSGKAQAAFKKIHLFSGDLRQHRIDDRVKWNRSAFPFAQVLGRQVAVILRLIFNDRELQRQPDLRATAAA